MTGLAAFLWARRAEILAATGEHVLLVGVSLALAAGAGIPLGILLTRRRGLSEPVLGGVNVLQTIPSLALLGLLVPLPLLGGIGARPAITALTAYALLPIVRNTYEGIRSVDPAVREAGIAMGMTPGQLLRRVELPLALGVILGGVRTAAVIGVGVATVAAAIGAGGLGEFIFRGLAMVSDREILAGALPAAALALAVDRGLGLAERRWSRWRE